MTDISLEVVQKHIDALNAGHWDKPFTAHPTTKLIRALAARVADLEAERGRLQEALEAIYEVTVEPAETDHHSVRGWIEVTARAALQEDRG